MKKLKSKVFFTIFLIFTLSLVIMFSISNYQFYKEEKSMVEGNIIRLITDRNAYMREPNSMEPKIFADTILYSITYNDNEIVKITSHNDFGNVDEIKSVAEKILSSDKLSFKTAEVNEAVV